MSAKPTEAKPDKKVDEVAEDLAAADLNDGDKDAKKKADKKARQKAKKEAMKAEENANKPEKDEEQTKSNEGSKKKKNKKSGGGNKGGSGPKTQTDPPSIAISELFPSGNFPEGQIMEHPIANDDSKAKQRFGSEEARALDRAQLDMYNEIR